MKGGWRRDVPSTGKSSNSSSSSSCGADVLGAAVWEVLAGSGSLEWVGWSLAVGAVDMMAVGCGLTRGKVDEVGVGVRSDGLVVEKIGGCRQLDEFVGLCVGTRTTSSAFFGLYGDNSTALLKEGDGLKPSATFQSLQKVQAVTSRVRRGEVAPKFMQVLRALELQIPCFAPSMHIMTIAISEPEAPVYCYMDQGVQWLI